MTQSSISLQHIPQFPQTISSTLRREGSRISTENLKPSMKSIDIEVPNASKSEKSNSQLEEHDWQKDYEHIDVDWSMQAMDVLYNASFFDYIRDEKNLELSSIRLSRIIKDYKPKQVANALIWMIQGWTVENTAKLLRSVFADWLPDLAGCVFSLISKSWPKIPQLSLCTAYVLLSEPAGSVALFIRTLTESWSKNDTIDLIRYLDNLLEVICIFPYLVG